MANRVRKDRDGKLYAGDIPLPFRIEPDGDLVFLDKDHRRAANRGSPVVRVPLADLLAAVGLALAPPSEPDPQ